MCLLTKLIEQMNVKGFYVFLYSIALKGELPLKNKK